MAPPKKPATGKSRPAKLPPERVSIDFVVLGDFAQVANGKLTIVGAGWNIVTPQQYPLALPFGIGIGILVPWNETNRRHPFSFEIRGESGVQMAGGNGEVEAGRQPGLPAGMAQRVVLGISGQLQLGAPGLYEIVVKAAGQQQKTVFQAMPLQRIGIGSG